MGPKWHRRHAVTAVDLALVAFAGGGAAAAVSLVLRFFSDHAPPLQTTSGDEIERARQLAEQRRQAESEHATAEHAIAVEAVKIDAAEQAGAGALAVEVNATFGKPGGAS